MQLVSFPVDKTSVFRQFEIVKSQLQVGQGCPARVALLRPGLMSIGLASACLALFALTPAAFAVDRAWEGDASVNWNNTNNWTGGDVPDAGDNAVFDSNFTGSFQPTFNTNDTLDAIIFAASLAKNVTISAGGQMRLEDDGGIGIDNQQSTYSVTINPSIRVENDQTWQGYSMAFGGGVNTNGSVLTLNPNSGSTMTFSGVVSGSGDLIQNGPGTTLLSGTNTFSGGLTVASGTAQFGNDSAAGTGTLTLNGGAIEAFGAARSLNEAVTVGGNFAVGGSQNLTLSGAMNLGGSVRTIAVNNSGLTTFSGTASGAGGITKAGAGTLVLGGGNSYTGATTVNQGTLRAGSAGTAFGNNSAVTLANTAGVVLDLNNFNTTIGSLAGGGTTGGNVTLGSATLTTGGNNGSTAFGGVISGTGGITKSGTGTWTLTGANTYSGATAINAGAINIQNATALGTTAGATTVASGAQLQVQGSITTAEALTVSGTGLAGTGAIRNISGNNVLSGGVTRAAATTITSDAGLLTLSGPVSGNFALTVGGAGNTTVSGIVSGTAGLNKNDAGTLTLTGANSYTGATAINAGIVNIQNATALGTTAGATTVSSGAQLQIQGGITSAEALTVNGTGVSAMGAIRNISGNNVLSGAVTRAGATTITSDAGLLTLSGPVSGNFALTVGGAGNTTVSGIVSGTAGLTKNDAGTLVLSGANTYDGVTTLNAGILSVSSLANGGTASNIGDSSNAAGNLVFNGGTLLYTGAGSNTNRLFTLGTGGGTIDASGSGALNFNNTGALTISGAGARTLTLTGNSTATNNLSADISGSTSLVKDGTGTWRISGDNTFTGNATVKNGLLEMNSNTINGGVPSTAGLIVGDGVGAANSAIARNIQEGQLGNTSTVTVYSDGWFDLNSAAYPNKGGDAFWKEETVGQINLYGGRITTGSTGSLNIDASLPGATIASFSSSQTALIDATGGQVALNANRTISVGNGSQTTDLEIRGTIANSVTGNGSSSITKTGDGRLTFTGTEANSYTGATVVNGGTLELAKSSGVTSIASSAVTVNSGGTLLLGSNNQINNAANLTLNNGILSTGETVGYSETLGTLTMSGSSSIDLGTAAHMLNFANSSALSGSWSGTLTIYGWTGLPATSGTSGQIFFGNNVSGLTSGQLSMVSFDGFGPGAMLLSSGELVPVAVPEAEVVLAALLLLGAVAWRERKSFRAKCSLITSSLRSVQAS